ncbi:MAG: hypothetical protein WC444_01245 [Candidatus Paceibacterota bacterium]
MVTSVKKKEKPDPEHLAQAKFAVNWAIERVEILDRQGKLEAPKALSDLKALREMFQDGANWENFPVISFFEAFPNKRFSSRFARHLKNRKIFNLGAFVLAPRVEVGNELHNNFRVQYPLALRKLWDAYNSRIRIEA